MTSPLNEAVIQDIMAKTGRDKASVMYMLNKGLTPDQVIHQLTPIKLGGGNGLAATPSIISQDWLKGSAPIPKATPGAGTGSVPTSAIAATHGDYQASRPRTNPISFELGKSINDIVTGATGGIGDLVNYLSTLPSDTVADGGAAPTAPDINFTPQTYTPQSYDPVTAELAKLPTAPNFEFRNRDFTPDANRMTAAAYQPAYDALDQQAANARNQYHTNDRVVGGLYDQLIQKTAQQAQADQARYAAAGTANNQLTTNTANAIGDQYNAAAQQEAALAKQYGLTTADTFKDDLSEKAYQQAQVQRSGQAQGQKYTADQQAQGQADAQLRKAQQTNKTVAGENLIRLLDQNLQGVDSARADLGTQQGLKSLDLAQSLAAQDINMQQLQYGVQRDQIGDLRQNAQMENEAAIQRANEINQAAQFNTGQANQAGQYNASTYNQAGQFNTQMQVDQYNQEMARRAQEAQLRAQASSDAAKLQYQQMRDQIGDRQWKSEFDAKYGNQGGLTFDQSDAYTKALAQVGGNTKALDLAENTFSTNTQAAGGARTAPTKDVFISMAAQNALNHPELGVSIEQAKSAAAAYFDNIVMGGNANPK